MSFNRLPYDRCSYKQTIAETTGPGIYQLGTPQNVCQPCHTTNPYIRLQGQGASISRNNLLVDVDSELLGITRNLSDCSERKYMPQTNASELCGANTGNGVKCHKSSKVCVDHIKNPIKTTDCFKHTEDTRLSNPPCTLRSTGWNRWEWLPINPQEKVEIPYDHQISSRTLAKDNHRPCIPKPSEQFSVYPEDTGPLCQKFTPINCKTPLGPKSVNWQKIQTVFSDTCNN